MKKITLLLSTIFAAVILSSCVYVNTADPIVVSTHSITFVNDTSMTVEDWYVKNSSDTKFVLSNYASPVYSGSESTISWLNTGFYKVIFTFDPNCRKVSYESSDYIWLDEDVQYKLTRRVIVVSRNAEDTVKTEEYVLVGSDGSEIKLISYTEDEE